MMNGMGVGFAMLLGSNAGVVLLWSAVECGFGRVELGLVSCAVDGFDEGVLGVDYLVVHLLQALSRRHHHLHHQKRVAFLLAQVELLPRAFPQNIPPALSPFIVPVEPGRVLEHLPIKPQHLYIRKWLFAEYKLFDGFA